MPPQNILISLRCAPLHQDILHRWLDKRQYSIYTEKGKRVTDLPLLPQSHFSAVDSFYRVFFAEPKNTTEASILLSVIAMNIDRLATMFVRLIWILIFRNPGLQLWGC